MSYYWGVSPYDYYDFTVSIDDGTNVTQVFTETDDLDFASNSYVWLERTIDLSAYIGQSNVKVIFNYSGADGASLAIDDVLVEETPSCPMPTAVAASATSPTEAAMSWTAGGSETNWAYEYDTAGFALGSGTYATTTSTSNNISGLTPGQAYDVYVQAICGVGDSSVWTDTVTWVMPLNPPANDSMAGAIPITPSPQGTGCNSAQFTLNFSTDGTTDSGLDGACDGTDTGLDQFFTWTATTVGLMWNDEAPGYPGIIIRDSSGNEIDCAETFAANDQILTGWNVGDSLIIQIYDFDGSLSDVAFCLEEYTPPAPIVPNYSEMFNSYPANRWSEATGAYGSPSGISSSFIGDDFVNDTGHPNGTSARINIFGSYVEDYLISPKFNLSGGTYYLNYEIGLTEYGDTSATTMGDDDYLALLVTQDQGVSWQELSRWDTSTAISQTGQSAPEITLSGYGSEVQFAFYAFSDVSNEDNDLFIDSFRITTGVAVAISEQLINDHISLYPNPTNGMVSIDLSLIENPSIKVFNTFGQIVKAETKIRSDLYQFELLGSPGLYFVEITDNKGNKSYIKLIKSNK
jgi:hypothetical protein